MKISFTSVAIDIFHYGHLRLLEQAKKVADYHICGLYSDDLCLKWNGNLIMNYPERATILEALSCVDEIIEQPELDPTNNLKLIHRKYPDAKIIFFRGHQEWEGLPGTNYVKSIGGEIIKPDYYSKLTRTGIRDGLNNSKKSIEFDIESYLLGDVSYFPLYNSTKANTLASLKPFLEKSLIEELFIFTWSQWEESPEDVLNEINEKFKHEIVIRSSSGIEDNHFSSYAGFFHSELNIDPNNKPRVRNAISKVIASYSKHDVRSKKDQILVQAQTRNVVKSGVVFTRNIQNSSPYYLINFDNSSLTDSVTSGQVGNKLEIIGNVDLETLTPVWKPLIESVKEIEESLHNLALDIEFAIKESGEVVIFQVRPIAAIQKFKHIPDKEIYNKVNDLIQQYKKYSEKSLLDSHYTLSDMSFWNPAEIIGDRASNLSYSIHRYLILSRVWNIGLRPLGYKEIDRDLVVRFGNKPYIDVETAFTALLPGTLDDAVIKKLVLYYQKKLESNPELHDKIEFEIVHSCYSPLTKDRLEALKPVLSKSEFNEFKNALLKLTQEIFDNYNDIKESDLDSIEQLSENRTQSIKAFKTSSIQKKIAIIVGLLDDAKQFGTPQFSRLARLAFIGNQYLRDLVSKGIISNRDSELFLSGIETVASELKKDFDRVISNKISVERFNTLYGHLRPGTYDITKLPYSKDPGYFSLDQPIKSRMSNVNIEKRSFKKLKQKISPFLDEFEISISVNDLLEFIEDTTKLRERFKFEFTKNLSTALELLAEVGEELGFDRKKLSYLSIESLKGLTPSSGIHEIVDHWQSQVDGKKASEEIYHYVALPSLIFSERDFKIITSHTVRPNFITNSIVKGDIVHLDSIKPQDYDLISARIVLLEKADPGYDWIFSKGIKGLITRFGGAASHMAIRCAEFGIPAAIGCGEIIFKDIMDNQVVELDCMNRKISTIR